MLPLLLPLPPPPLLLSNPTTTTRVHIREHVRIDVAHQKVILGELFRYHWKGEEERRRGGRREEEEGRNDRSGDGSGRWMVGRYGEAARRGTTTTTTITTPTTTNPNPNPLMCLSICRYGSRAVPLPQLPL